MKGLSNHPQSSLATSALSPLKPGAKLVCLNHSPCVSLAIQAREIQLTVSKVEYLPESKAHVFNAGAPVWAIDWCPIHVDDRPSESFCYLV